MADVGSSWCFSTFISGPGHIFSPSLVSAYERKLGWWCSRLYILTAVTVNGKRWEKKGGRKGRKAACPLGGVLTPGTRVSQQMPPSASEPGAPVWQGTHSAGSARQPTALL